MSQQNDNGLKGFTIGTGGVLQYSRVKLAAGLIVLAGDEEGCIGIAQSKGDAGEVVTVKLLTTPGTFKVIAAGVITANSNVFAAADGEVEATGVDAKFYALEAASGAGSIIEVLSLVNINEVSQANNSGYKAFTVGTGGVLASSRVKLAAGLIVLAGDEEGCIGIAESTGIAAAVVVVKLLNAPGTFNVIAAGTITINTNIFGAADGEVEDTGTDAKFYALEGTTVAGTVIEALSLVNINE